MTTDSISLNIVHEPKVFKRKKTTVPINPEEKTKELPVKNIKKKETKVENDGKMTVWKALKRDGAKAHKEKGKPSSTPSWKSSKLFTNNPLVPVVTHKAVQPLKEPLFTGSSFGDLNLHPYMVKELEEGLKLTKVMAVQEKVIPAMLTGKDLLVRSQTGSGKTLAFALPIVQTLQAIEPKLTRADGVHALVIVPSRELAIQTHEIFVKLTKSFTWLVPGILMGGERRKAEKARLRKGITILTSTPGRLLDHVTHTNCLDLSKVRILVLDEADYMLDLGYEENVSNIVKALEGGKRQTILLSATLSPGVERLAGLSLNSPLQIDVADVASTTKNVPIHGEETVQDTLVLPTQLHHSYVMTPPKLRLVTLISLILDKCSAEEGKMIVFMATQDMIDFHTALIGNALHEFSQTDPPEITKLHGKMDQADRTKVFRRFREASAAVLFCTDVASRGLDLPQVGWVVQYNGPSSVADYVHRVGRTARRGQPGNAVLFLSTNEAAFVEKLEAARLRVSPLAMDEVLNRLRVHSPHSNTMQEAATRLQALLESVLDDEASTRDLACKAFASWVRFYASYPRELKNCFSVKAAHLGHFAKSFALKEPPKVATQRALTLLEETRQKEGEKKKRLKRPNTLDNAPSAAARKKGPTGPQRPSSRHMSEFDSGLPPIKKSKKK